MAMSAEHRSKIAAPNKQTKMFCYQLLTLQIFKQPKINQASNICISIL